MPAKCNTPMSDINAYIEERIRRYRRVIIRTLCYIGEACVNEARSYHGKAYLDQTGNLRSSVGYIVVVNGQVVQDGGFVAIKEGQEGTQSGKEYAMKLAAQYPHDAALFVVAGRNYAKYVVAKGYNVLQSAESLAEKLVPQLLSQL
ncbi:MAG: hypothetical protein IKR17_02870 [Bacteroidales bacterium]|nr:hypothetical protein [Bacteroidales bacterium]